MSEVFKKYSLSLFFTLNRRPIRLHRNSSREGKSIREKATKKISFRSIAFMIDEQDRRASGFIPYSSGPLHENVSIYRVDMKQYSPNKIVIQLILSILFLYFDHIMWSHTNLTPENKRRSQNGEPLLWSIGI